MSILLKKYFADMAKEIENGFQSESVKKRKTPQDIADIREKLLLRMIKRVFPYPYKFGKGEINDSFGNKSHSVDIVVLNPIHPNLYNSDEIIEFILADGVDFAIEVKGSSSRKEIETALLQIRSVKKLRRVEDGLCSRKQAEEIGVFIKQIFTFIFIEDNACYDINKMQKIFNIIEKYYLDNSVPLEEQFDYIVINNVGLFINCKQKDVYPVSWNGNKRGISFISMGADTLTTMFMLMINGVICAPKLSKGEKMLLHYIDEVKMFANPLTFIIEEEAGFFKNEYNNNGLLAHNKIEDKCNVMKL